jgi:4-amino-4-deoxy-L-arabinose transferase-like glycosyltransferase
MHRTETAAISTAARRGAASPARLGLRPWSAMVIITYGASLLLIGLDRLVMTYHEVNYSEPAREMLRGSGWLMTRFAGQPFVEKPPLINWSIAAAMALFHSDSGWVARLPSVLSAIAGALLIAAIAARWFGDRIGLYSGLAQLTSTYVQAQGRRAEPDMLLCALVSAAMAVFALGNIEVAGAPPSARANPRIFYGAAALSFLPKGPIGPVLVLLPCAAFAVLGRASRRFLLDPAGLCIFFLIVLAWPIALFLGYPAGLASLWSEHWLRLSGAWGTQAWLLYLYIPFLLMLPWTPLVLSGAAALTVERAWTQPIWRLMALWIAAGTLFMSLSPFKHWHYMVPILPPLSILAAVGLERLVHAARPHFGVRMLLIASSLLAVPALYHFLRPQAGLISALMVLAMAGMSVALYLQWRWSGEAAAAAIFVTVWIVSVAAQLAVTPRFQTYLASTQMARRVNLEVPAGSPLYLMGAPHSQMVYYLTMPIVAVGDPGAVVRDSMARRQAIYVLGPRWTQPILSGLGEVQTLDQDSSLRRSESERDRLLLMKLTLSSPAPERVPPTDRQNVPR